MRSFLGFLCTLSALLSSCYSLSCTKCFSLTDNSCIGPSVTCPADNACAASYTVTSARGVKLSQVYAKDCVPRQQCDIKGSMAFTQNIHSSTSITCCYSDNCLPPEPALPAHSNRPNGLVCRSCMSTDSLWCYTDDTMQCTGEENMCLLQTTKIRGPTSTTTAFRGCASKSICDLGRQSVKTSEISVETDFRCTSGSVGVFRGVLLPLLLGIVLTKLLS